MLAPFEGFVVEGDLREKIAAPVKQGDVLLQVAKIDALFPELRVPEESIHEVVEGAAVDLAFASRPRARFPGQVERIEPLADSAEKAGVASSRRCRFDASAAGVVAPGDDRPGPHPGGQTEPALDAQPPDGRFSPAALLVVVRL